MLTGLIAAVVCEAARLRATARTWPIPLLVTADRGRSNFITQLLVCHTSELSEFMVGLEAVAKTMALAAHPTRQPQCGVFEVPFSAVADRKGQSKT
jgi:hypothetical protein